MILIYIIQSKRLITQLNTQNNSWYIAIVAMIQYIKVFYNTDGYIMYPLIYTNNYSGNLYFILRDYEKNNMDNNYDV